jgi:DNA repair exonuclease SbcCD ATPase subunit
MVDLLALAQGFQAIRSASEITQTLIGLRDSAKLLEKTVELNREIAAAQTALFGAQSEQASLVKTIDELEKEITRLKSWETEKKRYELKRYDPGVFFYVLKVAEAAGEPIHHLCTKCYQEDKKSIIHRTGNTMAREATHFCPKCRTEFYVWLRNASDNL